MSNGDIGPGDNPDEEFPDIRENLHRKVKSLTRENERLERRNAYLFHQLALLRLHKDEHPLYPCHKCILIFGRRYNLNRHLAQVHHIGTVPQGEIN